MLAGLTPDGCSSYDSAISWAPDSHELALWCDEAIFRVKRDGTTRHRLNVAADGRVSSASWSPDSRLIAFGRSCAEDGHGALSCDIAVMKPDGTAKRTLVRRDRKEIAGPDGHLPVWSSDGRLLVDEWGFRFRILAVEPDSARRPRVLYPTAGWGVTAGPNGSFAMWTVVAGGDRHVLEMIDRTGKRVRRQALPHSFTEPASGSARRFSHSRKPLCRGYV